MFFDENEIFRLDEMVALRATFKKIMEDGVVTDEELEEQSALVLSILQRVERTFSPEQLREVEELLTEMIILYAIYQYKGIQDIHR